MRKTFSTTARDIIASVDAFEAACNEAEYTDTGAVWELLYEIRNDLQVALQPKRGRPPKGKRWPVTSVESQTYIETGELPNARG